METFIKYHRQNDAIQPKLASFSEKILHYFILKENHLIFISNMTHDRLYDIHQNKICMAEHVVGFLIQFIFRCICI